ncbi:4-hydroxy-tetrahydrodipicolinate synthase [Labeo rohita]|uniref:4-hydroxy-tetrahydrodipicolinate synthase n=1 Tax=Labeo rohita TaxID=84645 RepID=A0ABQ8LJH8_LABRO|nr:4-hydroxy-tetrahydrodipicolinate synthase [Labeo rohita]
MEEEEDFWSKLDEVVVRVPKEEKVVIGPNFNGHVGEGNRGDEEKKGEHRVTYKSGERCTQVDHVLCRRCNLKEIKDYKVVAGDCVARQHRMVVCRMTLEVKRRKRVRTVPRRCNLKEIKDCKVVAGDCVARQHRMVVCRMTLEGRGETGTRVGEELPKEWAEVVRETARKVLGMTSGQRKEDKEAWWWNEEVQESIRRKKLVKKNWDSQKGKECIQKYKEMRHKAKKEVAKAKEKLYDKLYEKLNTEEGKRNCTNWLDRGIELGRMCYRLG